MDNLNQYKLHEIIDAHSLQHIQDRFSKMTNLSTVTVDKLGNPVTAPSNFSKFCTLIRSSKVGYERCTNCDAEGGLKSMLLKKPIIYTCHAGLTDLCAPIVVNDIYLGCMLCGQVLLKENKDKSTVDLKKLSMELDLPIKELEYALNHIKTSKYNKLIDAADFLSLFSNLIAKMGIANISHAELLKETKEKMKFQQLAKDAQIKSIQSQINPHFLFNTLNTISGMALMENCDITADLIYALSDILRYSIKNSEDMVKISTEIDTIEKYLFIQSVRYNDKISYDLKISEEVLNYKIPAMTLQPLIENAIIHGLEPKNGPGKITIYGNIASDKLAIIKIEDNGVGISSDKLNMIMNNINSSNKLESIGIKLVQDRLLYYFGSEFSIKISSIPYVGTTVYIKIPLIY